MLVLRRVGQSNRRRFPLAALLSTPAGDQTIAPSGIASVEGFGSTTVSTGAASQTIAPTSIASAEAFGTATAAPGAVSIVPAGIASGFATGTTELLMAACVAGVLTVDGTNARYVRNTAGIVYLAGFHTWYNVQDGGSSDPPSAFDWDEYLSDLVANGCNFTKLWASLETPRGWSHDNDQWISLQRYERTGPGTANDGDPKFDLTKINPAFIARLRERVIEAGNAGVYCVIQLWQGWQVENGKGSPGTGTPGLYHPYHPDNNINSVNGDPNNDDDLRETQLLASNPVLSYQEAMVEAIIDAVNDLDNVIFEICNEPTGSTGNTDWQEYLITHIQTYEASKAKQHLVGMTVQWPSGDNSVLDTSGADWVSYNSGKADIVHSASDPVSFRDSDHVEGIATGYADLFFEPFCNGHGGVWLMDPWDGAMFGVDTRNDATWNLMRRLSGDVRSYAERMDLVNAAPNASLATTGYCIAKTTGVAQILAYQPGSGAFNLTLTSISGTFSLEWFRVSDGTTQAGSDVAGGAVRTLTPPWSGAVAAFLELAELLITPSGIASGAAFGTATIAAGEVAIAPSGIASAEAFGAASIIVGAVTVAPTGIASTEAFGTASTQPGGVTVAPSGVATGEAFGAVVMAAGAVTIVADGIATAEAFGTALIQAGASYIAPTGIASAEAHGDATVQSGTVSILPAGIASSETHGETLLATGAVLQPTGIASGEAHGSTVVQPGAVSILASGIASAEALGTAALLVDLLVAAAGIATGEAFGDALLSVGGAFIQATGIASGETFGDLVALTGAVSIMPAGIAGGEAFGTLRLIVAGSDQYIDVPSVQAGETFGIATLLMALIAERTLSVQAETRRYVVAAENRTYSVTR